MAIHVSSSPHILVIGAGIGGLTTAALLSQTGYEVTVLEAETYPGGCAGTYFHKGYRFDAGATLAGGFQAGGPHALVGERLGIEWPISPADPAWVVHLPDRQVTLSRDQADVLRQFPGTESFWAEQARVADLVWSLAARGLPWPPTDLAELVQLARVGLASLPGGFRLLPLAFRSAYQWLDRHNVAADPAFLRFIDAQLLISAQATARNTNALYSATALDLARQGVYHVRGGIGSLAQTLADSIQASGGRVLYKHRVTRIVVENGRVVGVHTQRGRREGDYFACDFLVANLTPWSLDRLLGDDSPARLRREVTRRQAGWGAFVLYLGVEDSKLPADLGDHHQIVTDLRGPLGEGRSVFVSLSPRGDASRAPARHRAVTVTTHTDVRPWWDLVEQDHEAYQARKDEYTRRMLSAIDSAIPGFQNAVKLMLPGTPVTYQTFTGRFQGMVGGFPQVSLLRVRGPRTGLPNLRLVGDSIFPGQSTAGTTFGAMRVAAGVERALSQQVSRKYAVLREAET